MSRERLPLASALRVPQAAIAELRRACVNGRRCGYLAGRDPADVVRVLKRARFDIATVPTPR
ncbi:MAG: hypothetical protein ABI585_11990 [Betaproteobacteria bacterium]